jgi:hypothetical protein
MARENFEQERETFLTSYAKVLGCNNDVASIAATLINSKRNYQTATSTLFGLSWRDNLDWLKDCSKHLQESWDTDKHGKVTPEWLWEFQAYYLAEVCKYPE